MKDWLSGATNVGKLNWVELLPYIRRLMHDTPGISGYSPHKLVFNRDRHMAGYRMREQRTRLELRRHGAQPLQLLALVYLDIS